MPAGAMQADDFSWGASGTALAPITNTRRSRRSQSVEAHKPKTTDLSDFEHVARVPVVIPHAAARAPQKVSRSQPVPPAVDEDAERMREELAQLRHQCAALQADVTEKRWAVERARELGTALDTLSEENALLRKENVELSSKVKELAHLQHVQVLLLQALDATADPFMSQQLLLKIVETAATGAAPSGDSDGKVRFLSTGCKNCLITREERVRTDLMMREKGGWQQIELQWDVTTCTQRYTSAQISEVETERMWQEDMLAHRLALEHLQAELSRREGAQQVAKECREQEALWKEKYQSLREAGLIRMDELRQSHEDELQRTRLKYMRLSPDMGLLRHLILSGVKSHFNNGKLMIFISNMHRKLLIAKEELLGFRREVLGELHAMHREISDVIRRCAPMEWAPVEQESSSPPAFSRPGRQPGLLHQPAARRSTMPSSSSVIVRAPQLSPRSRNAKVVVVRSPTRR
jgi:hypothetical protein